MTQNELSLINAIHDSNIGWLDNQFDDVLEFDDESMSVIELDDDEQFLEWFKSPIGLLPAKKGNEYHEWMTIPVSKLPDYIAKIGGNPNDIDVYNTPVPLIDEYVRIFKPAKID